MVPGADSVRSSLFSTPFMPVDLRLEAVEHCWTQLGDNLRVINPDVAGSLPAEMCVLAGHGHHGDLMGAVGIRSTLLTVDRGWLHPFAPATGGAVRGAWDDQSRPRRRLEDALFPVT